MAINYGDPNSALGGWSLQPSWGGGSAAYGRVPAPVSPQEAQGTSIAGNLANVGQIYNLATGVGAASGAGGAANLNAALPGATAAQGLALGAASSEAAGQVSPSTISNIERMAAERGVATGDIGSPNANASLLQNLGLTTENLQHTGIADINSITSNAPVGPAFNPNTQLVDPNAQIAQENFNNELAAAPDPSAAARTNLSALNAGRGAAGSSGPSSSLPGMQPTISPAGNGGTGGFYNPATAGNNDSGATAYQQQFGQSLPPGQTYDPITGLILDENGNVVGGDPNQPQNASDGGLQAAQNDFFDSA